MGYEFLKLVSSNQKVLMQLIKKWLIEIVKFKLVFLVRLIIFQYMSELYKLLGEEIYNHEQFKFGETNRTILQYAVVEVLNVRGLG